jgi:hypothetical protein
MKDQVRTAVRGCPVGRSSTARRVLCITSALPPPRLRPSRERAHRRVLRQVMHDGTPTTVQPPGQRLLLIALVGCLAIFGTCMYFHSTNRRVDNDPASQASLAAAKEEAQTLLDALEKYRGDGGLYPPTLDKLVPAYLPSLRGIRMYRYSARSYDWVYKSDACADRRKSLDGWVLKEAQQYQKEVAGFKQDCLTGYHHYQLQSHNFRRCAESLHRALGLL